jgi:hypothetical protein
MQPKDKIKSLATVFDEVDGFVIKSEMSEEDYKEVIKKVTYMLALAYDKGYADGQKEKHYPLGINPQDLTSICLKCGIDLGKCICK